jgi:hypothetical protein
LRSTNCSKQTCPNSPKEVEREEKGKVAVDEIEMFLGDYK